MKSIWKGTIVGFVIYGILSVIIASFFDGLHVLAVFLIFIIGQSLFKLTGNLIAYISSFFLNQESQQAAYRELVKCKFPVAQWPAGEKLVWKQEWDDYCRTVIEFSESNIESVVIAAQMLAYFEASKINGMGYAFVANKTYQNALNNYLLDNQNNVNDAFSGFVYGREGD